MSVKEQVVFWSAVGLALILFVLTLQDILLPFVAGLVLAYALNPIVGGMTKVGLPRLLASILVVAVLAILLGLAVVFLLPVVVAQVQQFAAAIPTEIERLQKVIETWADANLDERYAGLRNSLELGFNDFAKSWSGAVGYIAQSLWSQGLALINFLALLLVTPVVVFYLLVDWPAIISNVDRWLPRAHAPTIRRVAGEIDAAISAFIRGQGLVCLILAVIYAIGLTWAGLKYGLLIGLATGLLSFIPFIGWITGLLIAVAFAIIEYWPNAMTLYKVLGVFAVGVSLDAGFLAPRVVGPQIGLHPVWLIFSLFVFSYLFGFVGTLVAVPAGSSRCRSGALRA